MRRTIVEILALLVGSVFVARQGAGPTAPRTRNVVLVVTDGLRWQEVFTGADSSILFGDPKFTGGSAATRRAFWRASANERRRALMPFLWSTVARDGQIFGNKTNGSRAQVTNGLKFSYPGYNEMLTGAPDPRIRDNSYGPNPNETVFDWLAAKPSVAGHVEALGTWKTFNDIFNRKRATFPVHADDAPDASLRGAVLRDVRANKPRLLFVGYAETDDWAHAGRYDNLLRSAHKVDAFVAELWDVLQSMPEYRGTTTLIVTTDHGRGSRGTEWRDHGEKIAGAEDIWIAVLGPDTPARGEIANGGRVTQSQIAATVAALLGEDYSGAVKSVGLPIRGVVGR